MKRNRVLLIGFMLLAIAFVTLVIKVRLATLDNDLMFIAFQSYY